MIYRRMKTPSRKLSAFFLWSAMFLLILGFIPGAESQETQPQKSQTLKSQPEQTQPDETVSEDDDVDFTDGEKAAILPIQGAITDVTVESLKRRIEHASKNGAIIIVFDMDTPGGLVSSSIAIADLIRELTDIKTVAWVNPNAHSGGSLIAVACDEIVMSRSSRIGDSQVIMGGPTGATEVPDELKAKAYTPVLHDFRQSAKLNGYSPVLCESFVLPDKEVWWIEHITNGDRKFVFGEEKARLFGESFVEKKSKKDDEDSDDDDKKKKSESKKIKSIVASVSASKDIPGEWKLVEVYYDIVLDSELDVLQPVVRNDQLLEMSAAEAYAYGFNQGVVSNEQMLKTHYNLTSVFHVEPNWSEGLAYWLTSMYVRGFLMLIIMLGAYVEFHTPGVGVPGLTALICLAIFVGAPYLTGLANVWEILILVIGIVLIGLEIFVIPGFGVAGISGLALVFIALLATFIPEEPGRTFPLYLPSLPSTIRYLQGGIITLVSSMLASLLGMIILSRYLPRTPLFARIVPANPTPSEVIPDDPYSGAARVGDTGVTEGPLHPSGKARFGNVLVDVVSQGEILDANARIEVIERRGNRVVVRAVT